MAPIGPPVRGTGIALDAGSKTRLLAWQTLQPPPILVVPARTDR
jgi:hypothetical protein